MHAASGFLTTLTVVLCVAGVTTVLFQRLKQPVVLGYLIAGMIVGPYVAVPLFADPQIVQTLSELGVILLMFSLGLEFRLRKLVQLGPTAGLTAIIQCALMIWLGYVAGGFFGWTTRERLFAGALISISSTTIIARAFDDQKVRGHLRELVVGVLIVEDLIAVLLMAVLTAISTHGAVSPSALAFTFGKLMAFLVGLIVFGLLLIPRSIRAVVRLGRPETTLVASVGICFAICELALMFGYSVALGAFLAGTLVAESGEDERIEHLVQPLRDLFAAIFFVAVGMLINPHLILEHWGPVLVFTALVIAGKLFSVTIGAFLTGNGVRTSVQAGMSLAQIGEFSFIIAALGKSLGATRDFLYPLAVAVAAITTLTTPTLIRVAPSFAAFADRKLPRPLQTFAALYGTWLERLPAAARRGRSGSRLRRLALLLTGDVLLLLGVLVGGAVMSAQIAEILHGKFDLAPQWGRRVSIAGGIALAVPLFAGVVRLGHALAQTLALAAFPPRPEGSTDLALAPRRTMIATLQIALALVVGVPVVAILQPFFPGAAVPILAVLFVSAYFLAFWKTARNLEGHVRAGAQVLAETLRVQPAAPSGPKADALLPGLGAPVAVRLPKESAAVGQSLASLNLRGRTGATVLAIHREGADLPVPAATELLRADDVLAVAGTHEDVEAAKAVLEGPAPGADEV